MRPPRSLADPRSRLAAALIFFLQTAVPGTVFSAETRYRVKPPDITIPKGATLGEMRRTFRPFPNWTLICDENLKEGVKICNITQTFIDANGATVFSWSLAASEAGHPVFILRAPPGVGPKGRIELKISNGQTLAADIQACDATTCIAMMPLGAQLRREIDRGEPVTIVYAVEKPVSLHAPLYGLAKAIAAID
jgi:invasion protein IalB